MAKTALINKANAKPKFAVRAMAVSADMPIATGDEQVDRRNHAAVLRARRPDLHVVVTGRNAKPALIEAADLVTEMGSVKHHFAAGVKAQEGIEF